jgi:hypothetical protein
VQGADGGSQYLLEGGPVHVGAHERGVEVDGPCQKIALRGCREALAEFVSDFIEDLGYDIVEMLGEAELKFADLFLVLEELGSVGILKGKTLLFEFVASEFNLLEDLVILFLDQLLYSS